ncbi:MAG: HDOD domain-containing protein, partial [Calditrichaeota bacterium]
MSKIDKAVDVDHFQEQEEAEIYRNFTAEFPFLEHTFTLNKLPSLPAIVLHLNFLLDQNRPSIKEVIRTILADPSLSLRVLSMLSLTPDYNPQNTLTVSRVIHYKGLKAIKSMFNDFTIFNENSSFEQQSGFDLFDFWKRSVFTALTAEAIAAELKLENREEAYLAGLFHDIGKLVLARFSPAANKKFSKMQKHQDDTLQREERTLKITHPQAGAQVGMKLHLPQSLVDVIQNHHLESQTDHKAIFHMPLIRIVYASQSVAKLFCYRDLSTHYFYEGRDRVFDYLQMP